MRRRIVSLLALAVVIAACGNKNSFQTADEPELQIEGSGFIRIVMPPDDARTQSQEPLIVRNAGDGVLKVKRFEFIDRPDRLVSLGERAGSCETTADCGADEICLTASRTCTSTLLPTVPFEIGPQLRRDIDFAIAAGPTELPCPEPTIEIPPEVEGQYCGALVIETNAINDHSGVVTDGKAIIWFLDPGASGDIQVEPSFIEFTNVQPGTTHTQNFSITNAGSEDLEITSMTVEDNSQYFTVGSTSGNELPLNIGSGQAEVFEMRLTIPENAENYEIFTVLNIASSGGPATLAVEITSAAGSAPVIELDQSVLRFDSAASQTLTISNVGEATLQLNGINVSPATARAFYTFEIDGNDVTNTFQTVNIPKDQTKDLIVGFLRPGGNTDPSVGLLEIAHNDRNNGFRSEVTLLGDDGDVPIARLSPEAFTFLAADGNSEMRSFVIRNVGTAALDISNITWTFSPPGSNAEFTVTPTSGTVAPGALLRGTASFSGMNAIPDVGLASFDSNNATPIELSLRALDSAVAQPAPIVTVETQGALRVNAPIRLNATSSTPAGSATNAIWTLLVRPSASTMWFDAVGEEASLTPDVAGTYTVALTILQGDREAQVTKDLVVE